MYIPLEEGESVVRKVHKHWWFIAMRAFGLVLILALPVALWAVARSFDLAVLVHASTAAFVALGALWGLVGWVMFWQFWTIWYMDMWVVTDRRLIDIDYKGFFDRDIAMLRLDKVQDLTVKVSGPLASVLGYGTILVQTAAAEKEFTMDDIADPEGLRDAISKLISR